MSRHSDLDNHANQLNPNNDAYWQSRDDDERPDDWDEKADRWRTYGAAWARKLGVSPSTIYMLRRGETWQHLDHPNQGREPKKKA